MYRSEMDHNPSFSSTLLDKIYRSIDDGHTRNDDSKFYRETMQKKQSKVTMKCNKTRRGQEEDDAETSSLQRACLIEKWMEKKANADRKSHHEYDHHDVHFFSSTSSSSDSSSGGFSSSDNESMYVTKSKSSCFVTSRPKPVRTTVSARSEKQLKTEKTEKKQRTLFDDYHCRAAKIHGNSKKAKQPISPGGRLASFINSLFTASNTKKARTPSMKYEQVSTCSSASSRSCLSKNSPSTRARLRNGVKRSVTFCPVDEDRRRPCGQKCLYVEEEEEEMASKFLKEYRLNQTKNDYIRNYVMDEDEDAASYSSSDLFELDHRVFIGNDRYREELPVYETTHVETNRAIANGLIA